MPDRTQLLLEGPGVQVVVKDEEGWQEVPIEELLVAYGFSGHVLHEITVHGEMKLGRAKLQ